MRVGLGGLTTVVAGLIGDFWGPVEGGLFLALPVILCASATLVEAHERREKCERGLVGHRRGTDAAALEAAGPRSEAWGWRVSLSRFGFLRRIWGSRRLVSVGSFGYWWL